MDSNDFSKTRHKINNKIATIDASLSAFRIYLQRLTEAGHNEVLYQKSLAQLKEVSADIVKAARQMETLISFIHGAEERT